MLLRLADGVFEGAHMGSRASEGKRATEANQAVNLHEKLSKKDYDANDNSSYLHSLVEFALRRIFCRCSRPVRGGLAVK
jgi:hypothetical protein